jgi:hypothetical protein
VDVAIRTILVALAFALLAAPSAAPNAGVPHTWWLDEQTALEKLRAAVKPGYTPTAFRTFSGRCQGWAPSALRDGHRVFQDFTCRARMRVGSTGYTFIYNVHVIGPRGRIHVGG